MYVILLYYNTDQLDIYAILLYYDTDLWIIYSSKEVHLFLVFVIVSCQKCSTQIVQVFIQLVCGYNWGIRLCGREGVCHRTGYNEPHIGT